VEGVKRGDQVTCTVSAVLDGGIEVTVEGVTGFIRISELARDRSEQRPDRFTVGEKVDAKVMAIDRSSRRLTLSVKALEVADEKQAMAEYGSSDSGASLGDILGAALNKAEQDRASAGDDAAAEEEAPVEEAAAAAEEAPAEEAAPAEEEAGADDADADAKKTDD